MKFPLSQVNPCRKLLLGFLLFSTLQTHAFNTVDTVLKYQQQSVEQKLWQHSEWLNLLHSDGDSSQPNEYQSQVADKQFFLADEGNTNPSEELNATLTGLFSTENLGDKHVQCRFIARKQWLIEKLSINPDTLPAVNCVEYKKWRKNIQPQQVTLIFPTYHLNSPSSMFGHTLLRLDSGKDENASKWLSVAINFGANVPEGDNSILYTYRGLAGGYPGLFVTDHYFKKIQEYNRIEHRDIWEYRLNLNEEETERMVQHIWEVQNINFDYYFFDENCSYRLLELLEIARPTIELTDEYIVTAIPIDTVKTIHKAGLVENIEYRPARATVLSHMLEQMTTSQQQVVIELSKNIAIKDHSSFTTLDESDQSKIVEAAYKYLRYQQSDSERDTTIDKRSFQLLKLRNSYPTSSVPDVPVPVSPELGHNSKRTTIALGKRLHNTYGELGFKMSFHDLEDNVEGFLQGAQINIGSIQIRAEDNEGLSLYKLDLIDIFSLTPRTAFFKPIAWRIYTGFERQLTRGEDKLGYHVTGGGGGSWKLFKDSQIYTLATARLEINDRLSHTLEPGIGFITGFLSHFGKNTARLEISGEHFTDDMYRLRTQYTHNFVINTNNSFKVYAKHEWQENDVDFSDVNISYQYYF